MFKFNFLLKTAITLVCYWSIKCLHNFCRLTSVISSRQLGGCNSRSGRWGEGSFSEEIQQIKVTINKNKYKTYLPWHTRKAFILSKDVSIRKNNEQRQPLGACVRERNEWALDDSRIWLITVRHLPTSQSW